MAGYSKSREDQLEKIDLSGLVQDGMQGVKKLWWLVVLLAVLFAAKNWLTVSRGYQPRYVASATAAVTSAASEDADYINNQTAQQMAQIFPYIMTSGLLQDTVAQAMEVDNLPGSISVAAEDGMNLLTISVTGLDAQAVYDELQVVLETYPQVAEIVLGPTNLDVLDETGVPGDTGKAYAVRGSARQGALKGAALGVALMAVYVLTRRTVKSRRELKEALNLTDCGSLPLVPKKRRKKSVPRQEICLLNSRSVPQGYLEALRKACIKIMAALEEGGQRVLLVTSSLAGEGKTTVAVNLAVSMAQQGKRVILVDCDPRGSGVGRVLGTAPVGPALADVLEGRAAAKEALQPVQAAQPGSLLVLHGSKEAEPLLCTARMEELIAKLREAADVVILDTAPAGVLADAAVLARSADAALYVVRYDATKLRQVRDGLEVLSESGVHLLGYLFNGDRPGHGHSYGYGYARYGYGRYGAYGGYGGRYGAYGTYSRYGQASLGEVGRRDKDGRIIRE